MQVAYDEGDVIYRPGDAARHMYFLVSGRVEIRPSRLSAKQLRKMAGLRLSDSDGESPDRVGASLGADVDGESLEIKEAKLAAEAGIWSAQDGQLFGV